MNSEAATDPAAEIEFARQLHAATPRVVVTPVIIALNLAMFVVMIAMGVNVLGGRPDDYLKFGANFGPLTTGGEWWRLLTCTFIHGGVVHLLFNLWALWDSGHLTERLYGNRWFTGIYLYAGVGGSLASLLWRNEVVSVGASGAIFGVFGALLAYTLRERGSIPPHMLNRLRISTSIFVTYSLFYGFAASGIDNAAHLGGLLCGFAMGLVAARPLAAETRRRGDLQRIGVALLLAALTLPTAARFAPDTSRVYREALALEKATAAFSAEERRLSGEFDDIVKRARDKKIDDRSALNDLRNKLLPGWDAAVAQLAAVELDARAPLRPDYELLLHYAQTRRDMTAALADFLEAGTPASRQAFLEKRSAAEAALKAYRERQTKK